MTNNDAAVLERAISKLQVAATPEELEAFIKRNRTHLQGRAEDVLRRMSPVDQKRVMAEGDLPADTRDGAAIIGTRAKRALETAAQMENNLARLRHRVAAGNHDGLDGSDASSFPALPSPGAPTFIYETPAEIIRRSEVPPSERRFVTPATEAVVEEPLEGTVCGVGGVIEVTKCKYGCTRGQRLKVIGQKGEFWQCSGGKTMAKNQKDKGWRWVIRKPDAAEATVETTPPPPVDKATNDKKPDSSVTGQEPGPITFDVRDVGTSRSKKAEENDDGKHIESSKPDVEPASSGKASSRSTSRHSRALKKVARSESRSRSSSSRADRRGRRKTSDRRRPRRVSESRSPSISRRGRRATSNSEQPKRRRKTRSSRSYERA
eukprot:TRINITY_DN15947_c0_g1_i2.p1 TRINITY_DN15947_c0_g1~~TRINITY_DN15947_c0_g1_i2.p1  ORF type:complete len:377 (+),score=52.58 TRINITY_DN15947_c0_g1_i2:84-1214(+)